MLKKITLLCLVAILKLFTLVDAGPLNYDQRQTGKYNIHVNLKDVSIISIDGGSIDSGDYDYNYDYGQLTIKPIGGILEANSTTSRPSTTIKTPPMVEIKPPKKPSSAIASANGTQSPFKPHIHPQPAVEQHIPVVVIMDSPHTVAENESLNGVVAESKAEHVKPPARYAARVHKCIHGQRNGKCRRNRNSMFALRQLVNLATLFGKDDVSHDED